MIQNNIYTILNNNNYYNYYYHYRHLFNINHFNIILIILNNIINYNNIHISNIKYFCWFKLVLRNTKNTVTCPKKCNVYIRCYIKNRIYQKLCNDTKNNT